MSQGEAAKGSNAPRLSLDQAFEKGGSKLHEPGPDFNRRRFPAKKEEEGDDATRFTSQGGEDEEGRRRRALGGELAPEPGLQCRYDC